MKKTIIAAAVLMAMAGTAQASNTCNHGCNSGGSSGTPPVTANGGAGGQGGAGGTGLGVGVSSSTSSARSTAQQGQLQGQAILGSGNSHQAQAQAITGSGNSSNANNSSLTSAQSVSFQQSDRPVSTALAPALTSGFDTCLGSFGVGAQGAPIGISFGSTKEENICVLIKLSKRAEHLHDLQLANALLCEDARWQAAKKAVGEKCPEGSVRVAAGSENPDPADRDLRPDWVRDEQD